MAIQNQRKSAVSSLALDSYPPAQRWSGLRWAVPLAIALAASAGFAWQAMELRAWLSQPAALSAPRLSESAPVGVSPAMVRLFGASSEPARPTAQRLRLRASFVHSDPSRSSALIVVENARPRRLFPGDEVTPGITLAAIHPDHVLLVHAGRVESLGLRRNTGEPRP